MTLSQWLFGGFENPFKAGQWRPLHICTMLCCVLLIFAFYFITKRSRDRERTRRIIVFSLAMAILFFEIMIRFVYSVKLYVLNQPCMNGVTALWIILPKPWCAIACWSLIASVFIKKAFFYNYASLSALLCSLIYFAYPGVGFNNEVLIFENWYSIITHSLLLTMSVTLITLKYTDFKYREIWKVAICYTLTYAYGLLQIYVLKTQTDPMYFMPGGDIQAGILKISYGLYLFLYIALILIFVNAFYLIQDRATVKGGINSLKLKFRKSEKE